MSAILKFLLLNEMLKVRETCFRCAASVAALFANLPLFPTPDDNNPILNRFTPFSANFNDSFFFPDGDRTDDFEAEVCGIAPELQVRAATFAGTEGQVQTTHQGVCSQTTGKRS